MKKLLVAMMTVSVMTASLQAANKKLKIMPVGDSITVGIGGNYAGYRYFLERDLNADRYAVDYVGVNQDNPCTGLKDKDHCGFSGWYLKGNNGANIQDNISTWLGQVDTPDVILLHIGTNDAKDLTPLTDRPEALSDILDKIAAGAPTAHVIVTTVLQRTDDASMDANIANNYNAYVGGVVSQHAAKGEKVHFLDMRAKLTASDLGDGLHPNDSGYQKMATAWKEEIEKLFEAEDYPFVPMDMVKGFAAHVPASELQNYVLVYDFTPKSSIYNTDFAEFYETDRTQELAGYSFDRVAYYVELQKTSADPVQWVWVSFDRLHDDLGLIGLPITEDQARQCAVSRMNVFSDVEGVVTGCGLTGGCVEFWPGTYGTGPDGKFDFDDEKRGGQLGSMQVHNRDEQQTILSYSMWQFAHGTAGLGIGNRPESQWNSDNPDPDWTWANNVGTFVHKRIQVFAHVTSGPVPAAPSATGATYDAERECVTVTFSGMIADPDVKVENFTLPGFEIDSCEPGKDGKSAVLWGLATTAGAATLTVRGIHDRYGNAISSANLPVTLSLGARGAEIAQAASIASEITQYVGADTIAGYDLLFAADIPVECRVNTTAGANREWQRENLYRMDRRATLARDGKTRTDRIAYCLVLETASGTQYAWTAMDAFTQDLEKMAMPEVGYFFQVCVSNMQVISNVSGVKNESNTQKGIIEFSASGYSQPPNEELDPIIGNGGANNFDWNDSGFSTTIGNAYGGMQVHNWGERQTVWAINHFNTGTCELGIGGGNDWTLSQNGGTYTSRKLYGFVLRSGSPDKPKKHWSYARPDEFDAVDESDDYDLIYTWDIPTSGVGSYSFDQHADYANGFDRIAYCMSLTANNGTKSWAWTSMEAFTDDLKKIGIPSAANGCVFQQKVNDLNVYASENKATLAVSEGGVVTGKHITTGNIEIWPSMFNRGTGPAEFGGDPGRYDWNDGIGSLNDNYGQMQVNNYGAEHTIWSVSAMYFTFNLGIGIGNNTSDPDNVDWTMSQNATSYGERKLYVLVRKPAPKTEPWGVPTTFLTSADKVKAREGGLLTLKMPALDAVAWQWYKDDELLEGANGPCLEIANAKAEDGGVYRCLVSTDIGASLSPELTVKVSSAGLSIIIR